ncbi:MAG: 50S ribosomal protein L17 [Patescibacteria group bacterium]
MRHHNNIRKFGRTRNQRKTLLRSLALNLITYGKMETTLAKAKELRPYIEKLVTKAKKDSLAAKRQMVSKLGSEEGMKKLFAVTAPKYKDRAGGYTRIIKLPRRSGDASPMAFIEFV